MKACSRAMILAAGFGTRLRPLTEELAKPLVWIGDRPAIAPIVDHLASAEEVVVNVHHRADDFRAAALARVRLVEEAQILGTAGGVRNAAGALGPGAVTVWNGDVLARPDLGSLERAHADGGALATLVAAPRPAGEGTLGVGADGRVVRLRGRRFGEEARGGDYLGIQRISAELRGRLPAEGCLVGDVYLPALERGERVDVVFDATPWLDVGSLGAYLAANVAWLVGRGEASFVHPSARVSGEVGLSRAVVLAGATVDGAGALEEVVVWPGARATAPLARAIVTPRAVVRVPET